MNGSGAKGRQLLLGLRAGAPSSARAAAGHGTAEMPRVEPRLSSFEVCEDVV